MKVLSKLFREMFSELSMRYVGAQVAGMIAAGLPASMYLSEQPRLGVLFLPVIFTSIFAGIAVYMAYRSLRYDVEIRDEIRIALISLLVYPVFTIVGGLLQGILELLGSEFLRIVVNLL